MVDHAIMNAFFREVGKIAAAPRLKGAQLVAHIEGMVGKARSAADTAREAFESHVKTLAPRTRLEHNTGKLDSTHELYSHPTYKAHQEAIAHLKTQEAEAGKLGRRANMNKVEGAPAPAGTAAPQVDAPAPTTKIQTPKNKKPAAPEAPHAETLSGAPPATGGAGNQVAGRAESAPKTAPAAAKPGFFQRNAGTLVAGSGIAALGGGGGYAASRMINRPQQ